MAAQWIAGVGNLAFAVAVARLLGPSDYAQVAAFLGVYLLLGVPGAALSAAGASDPARLAAHAAGIVRGALFAGVVIVAAGVPLAPRLDVDVGVIVALGVSCPAAALLGLRRGIAYGHERHRSVAASLVAEPLVRVTVGVALVALFGASGAAAATALAGYVAVGVLELPAPRGHGVRRRPSPPGLPAVDPTGRLAADPAVAHPALLAVASPFLLIAVFQTADLLVASRVLRGAGAAEFGVLSTIGGAAVFATATVPLVLIPELRRRHASSAAATAVALAGVVGAAVAVAGALLAGPFVAHTFGPRYRDVAPLVGPYLLAMALIAVIRVRLASLATRRAWPGTSIAVAGAVVAQCTGIALFARSPGGVVAATLLSAGALAVVLELPTVVHTERVATSVTWLRQRPRAAVAMVTLCALACGVRLATSRGLWVDEAISVEQAQLPFGEMLADMRYTDVHPPFHHALLWVTVRVFGTSELAVRLPSLIAGVALVPVLAWVGRVLYDRRTGWVAAAFAAVAPFCVWYSQEARMYSQFMLFAAVAVGAQVQAIRRGRRWDWILYGLSTAALLWTQYFAVLPIAVQQLAFAAAWWSRRRDGHERRRLLLGWLVSTLVVLVAVAPMLPLLRDQIAAYGDRGAGLVPGQAGAGNSTIGDGVSIYALGANLIWATLGYHADGAMVQLAALWPLLMLGALALLGRGRSRVSVAVARADRRADRCAVRRRLDEARPVRAALLLGSRPGATAADRPLRHRHHATGAGGRRHGRSVLAAMSVGLVDQQVNGANPRLYDFEGAFARIHAEAGPHDVVLYEPSYLAEVVDYYSPDIEAHSVGTPVPDGVTVWVLSTDRVVNAEASSARLGAELAHLEQGRDVVEQFRVPNVVVWELR